MEHARGGTAQIYPRDDCTDMVTRGATSIEELLRIIPFSQRAETSAIPRRYRRFPLRREDGQGSSYAHGGGPVSSGRLFHTVEKPYQVAG